MYVSPPELCLLSNAVPDEESGTYGGEVSVPRLVSGRAAFESGSLAPWSLSLNTTLNYVFLNSIPLFNTNSLKTYYVSGTVSKPETQRSLAS